MIAHASALSGRAKLPGPRNFSRSGSRRSFCKALRGADSQHAGCGTEVALSRARMSPLAHATRVRRLVVILIAAILGTLALTGAAGRSDGEAKDAFLDELQERTFRF